MACRHRRQVVCNTDLLQFLVVHDSTVLVAWQMASHNNPCGTQAAIRASAHPVDCQSTSAQNNRAGPSLTTLWNNNGLFVEYGSIWYRSQDHLRSPTSNCYSLPAIVRQSDDTLSTNWSCEGVIRSPELATASYDALPLRRANVETLPSSTEDSRGSSHPFFPHNK